MAGNPFCRFHFVSFCNNHIYKEFASVLFLANPMLSAHAVQQSDATQVYQQNYQRIVANVQHHFFVAD